MRRTQLCPEEPACLQGPLPSSSSSGMIPFKCFLPTLHPFSFLSSIHPLQALINPTPYILALTQVPSYGDLASHSPFHLRLGEDTAKHLLLTGIYFF